MTRALVICGATPLGRAVSLELAQRGYDVAIHHLDAGAEAAELVREIGATGSRATAIQADLFHEPEVQALAEQSAQMLGEPLTTLINIPASFEMGPLAMRTRTQWERAMACNLRAPAILTQALAAQVPAPVQDAGGNPLATGIVVNVIDQPVEDELLAGLMTQEPAASGLWHFTNAAARALAPRVRVNAIFFSPRLGLGSHGSERGSSTTTDEASYGDFVATLGYILDAPAVTGQRLISH